MNLIKRRNSIRWFREMLRHQGGVAITEFALALPVLITLLYGTIEVTRYILISQKVEKLANTVADVTTQSENISIAQIEQLFAASSDVMNPYTTGTNSRIIISSLYRKPGDANAAIAWQYPPNDLTTSTGAGSLPVASKIGAQYQIPLLPTGFTIDERENVIAAEIFYQFSPILTTRWFGTTTIYRSTYYKPRFGALLSAPI